MYFLWVFIFLAIMFISFLDKLLFKFIIVKDRSEKIKKSENIVIKSSDRKVNIGEFGRSNSESSIVNLRNKPIRSKTI